jgi:FtsZ-interacting cell division protein ZipA
MPAKKTPAKTGKSTKSTPRAAADPKHNTQPSPASQEKPKKDEPAKTRTSSRESRPSQRKQSHGEASRDAGQTNGPNDTGRDPANQASPSSSPRGKGPLAPDADGHWGQRHLDDPELGGEGQNPAVHAMNVLRRHAEVNGFVTHERIVETYDELGLDWAYWRETVRGV